MLSFLHPQRALLFLWLLGALVVSAPASAVSDVKAVHSSLKRAEANLNLVEGSIGNRTSPPKGSAAKLSRMRLNQALPDLEAAGKLVAGLKGGAGVAEAKARYASAQALYKRLDAILTGKPPQPAPKPSPKPAPKPGPTPSGKTPPTPPAAKTVKLGYPHADNFKNALFTLRRVESTNNALIKLMAEVQPIKDQLSIKYGTAAGAVETAQEGLRQAGFARTALNKVPSNGEGVAEAKQRLVDAEASIKGTAAYFSPLHARLAELVNPASYPDFQGDLKRLRELSQSYRDPEFLLREQRPQAAEAFQQRDASLAECQRIASAYARLVQQDTDMGRSVKGSCAGFERQREAFLVAAEAAAKSLPGEIRADSAEVQRIAGDAVANQKPMWFTGGIPQQMGWIDDKLALLEVLDPKAGATMAAEVNALKEGLARQADSLKELIIRENQLPGDSYTAADREAIVAMAKDAWKIQEADFELLAVRIPSDTWKRDTRWTYSNGSWYFVDLSSVQVRLIVADKENPALAIDRPINVRKDHTNGDKLYGVPLRSFDEELQPREYLLRSRIQ